MSTTIDRLHIPSVMETEKAYKLAEQLNEDEKQTPAGERWIYQAIPVEPGSNLARVEILDENGLFLGCL